MLIRFVQLFCTCNKIQSSKNTRIHSKESKHLIEGKTDSSNSTLNSAGPSQWVSAIWTRTRGEEGRGISDGWGGIKYGEFQNMTERSEYSDVLSFWSMRQPCQGSILWGTSLSSSWWCGTCRAWMSHQAPPDAPSSIHHANLQSTVEHTRHYTNIRNMYTVHT